MRCSFRVHPNKRFFNAKGREVPFLGPYAPAPPTLTSEPIAPFQTGTEPPGAASWGAWGESCGAPYSIRVSSKGRTFDDASDTMRKGSLSSSPRSADRGSPSWARAPHSRSPPKGGSDKENLGVGRASAAVGHSDSAVPLGENPNRWASARHNSLTKSTLDSALTKVLETTAPKGCVLNVFLKGVFLMCS
jgi:hypothetical protein